MKTNRERILMIGAGAIAFFYCGDWAYQSFVATPLQSRQDRIDRLTSDVESREAELRRSRRAIDSLSVWQAKSLPSDSLRARSIYQNWLLEVVGRVGLVGCTVDSADPVRRQGDLQAISFSVRGRGTLNQLAKLLYEFYRANHLHQIQSLTVTPLVGQGTLDLSLAVEALIVPGAEPKEALDRNPDPQWMSVRLADYDAIVRRDLFGIGGGDTDTIDDVFLTAVTDDGRKRQAWFTLRAQGKTLRLGKGESIAVGDFQGRVVDIDAADVVIEAQGERWLMSLGENLAGAAAVPPES